MRLWEAALCCAALRCAVLPGVTFTHSTFWSPAVRPSSVLLSMVAGLCCAARMTFTRSVFSAHW